MSTSRDITSILDSKRTIRILISSGTSLSFFECLLLLSSHRSRDKLHNRKNLPLGRKDHCQIIPRWLLACNLMTASNTLDNTVQFTSFTFNLSVGFDTWTTDRSEVASSRGVTATSRSRHSKYSKSTNKKPVREEKYQSGLTQA